MPSAISRCLPRNPSATLLATVLLITSLGPPEAAATLGYSNTTHGKVRCSARPFFAVPTEEVEESSPTAGISFGDCLNSTTPTQQPPTAWEIAEPDLGTVAEVEDPSFAQFLNSTLPTQQPSASEVAQPDLLKQSKRCRHGEQKSQCKDCGTGHCEHGRQESLRRDCGTGYCKHGRGKRRCKDCGTGHCDHGRQKSRCKDCGTGYCEHGRRKGRCKDCNELSEQIQTGVLNPKPE